MSKIIGGFLVNKVIQNIEMNDKKMTIVLRFQDKSVEDNETWKEIKAILTNELQQRIKEMNLL